MSSGYGTIAPIEKLASLGYPRLYFYAMSKAALNIGLRQFALEVGFRQVTAVLLSPGAVEADFQRSIGDYTAKVGKPITAPVLTPAESAHSMVVTIEQLKPEQNGTFSSRDGTQLPW